MSASATAMIVKSRTCPTDAEAPAQLQTVASVNKSKQTRTFVECWTLPLLCPCCGCKCVNMAGASMSRKVWIRSEELEYRWRAHRWDRSRSSETLRRTIAKARNIPASCSWILWPQLRLNAELGYLRIYSQTPTMPSSARPA